MKSPRVSQQQHGDQSRPDLRFHRIGAWSPPKKNVLILRFRYDHRSNL